VSDIFNPPRRTEPTDVECPDCGCARGIACGAPAVQWCCGARIWVARGIAGIEALRQPEPPNASPSRDDYASGWNDAIEAIVMRLRSKP
jgi:hypothetical protein